MTARTPNPSNSRVGARSLVAAGVRVATFAAGGVAVGAGVAVGFELRFDLDFDFASDLGFACRAKGVAPRSRVSAPIGMNIVVMGSVYTGRISESLAAAAGRTRHCVARHLSFDAASSRHNR
jgi:hypothetical protein